MKVIMCKHLGALRRVLKELVSPVDLCKYINDTKYSSLSDLTRKITLLLCVRVTSVCSLEFAVSCLGLSLTNFENISKFFCFSPREVYCLFCYCMKVPLFHIIFNFPLFSYPLSSYKYHDSDIDI